MSSPARMPSGPGGPLGRLTAIVLLTMVVIGSFTLGGEARGQAASAAPVAKPPGASATPAASQAPAQSSSAAPSAQQASSAAPPAHDSAPNPHGGMGQNPHGGMGQNPRSGPRGEYIPPEDVIEPDPALAPGTLSVSIVDKDESTIATVPILLSIHHNSISKGDTKEQKDVVSDAGGGAVFTDLQFGSSHQYRVTGSVGPAQFSAGPFSLPEKTGMHVTLHVYDATENLEGLRVFMDSDIRTSLREDVITVRQQYRIINLGPVAWLADVEAPLPKGFKAFQTPDDADNSPVKVLPTENGAVLRGTVPPGQTELVFAFHVPLNGSTVQSFEFQLFPRDIHVGLFAEASHKMTLSAEGFASPQFSRQGDGVSGLLTERAATRESGFIPSFTMTLNGLPTRGIGGYLAVGGALLALLVALAYRLSLRGKTAVAIDTAQDLAAARETLLDELYALERLQRVGQVGPKTYERSKALLLDALTRITARLDSTAPVAGSAPGLGGKRQRKQVAVR